MVLKPLRRRLQQKFRKILTQLILNHKTMMNAIVKITKLNLNQMIPQTMMTAKFSDSRRSLSLSIASRGRFLERSERNSGQTMGQTGLKI